jgi:hypothetical protein
MKIGILQNTQSPATDVLRTVHPFRQLGHETIIIDPANPKWFDLLECEILVASRPNGTLIHSILSEFKRTGKGKKIIVDVDDNLHELDPSNPSYPHFNSPAVKESVVACLNLADHIIFSTKALQDYYTLGRKIEGYDIAQMAAAPLTSTPSTVIHNAVDFNITPMMEPRPINKPVRVLWRGSKHHQSDLLTIRPFWDWILNNKDYEVLFMGMPPDEVYTYYPGAKCETWNPSPFGFWQKQASLKADIGIFPLRKTLFNLGKSDIFAQEQLCNGVLPIVPMGFPEFRHDGVFSYTTSEDLIACFKDNTFFSVREELIKDGQSWLLENRNLATVNLKRGEIIEGL